MTHGEAQRGWEAHASHLFIIEDKINAPRGYIKAIGGMDK